MAKALLVLGKNGIKLNLPHEFAYLSVESRSLQPLADPSAVLDHARDSPVAGASLVTLAQ
jgi:hypothetical protein